MTEKKIYNKGKKSTKKSISYTTSVEEFERLKDFQKKVDAWYGFYNEHILRARNFMTFLYIDQWDPQVRQKRNVDGRPTMQINMLVPMLRGIMGEQRDNSPELAVRPVNPENDVPQEQIDIRSDLLRQISYDSNSATVYQTAFRHQLECGWGAAYVSTEYENDDSLNKVLKINPIPDFQCSFFDPTAQLSDKSDGDYCGFYQIIAKEKFKELYPDCPTPQSEGNIYVFQWNSRETITICNMFYKDYYTKYIAVLSDGREMEEKEAKELLAEQQEILSSNPDLLLLPDISPLEIIKKEKRTCYTIKFVKFVSNKILEESDWVGKKYLPVVYFEGDSAVIDGERLPIPFVQDAIDVQRLINYNSSETAYALLTARKEHIFATPSNIAGHEELYRNPQRVQGALLYNPDDETKAAPIIVAPQQLNPIYIQIDTKSKSDMQMVTGRFEEARGMETNAVSGTAIAARKESSKAPVNVYTDNLARGIRQVGRILLDCLPQVYDTERNVTTRNIEGNTDSVTINKFNGFGVGENGEYEEQYSNNMRDGDWDIEVRVEGSFDSQTAKAFDTFGRMMATNPSIAPMVMDLFAEVSGLPNAEKLKKRLETLLPPNIVAMENGDPPPPPPPPPPPDPMVQLAAEELKLKDKKIMLDAANNAKKLEIDAQSKGLMSASAFAKANAEIEKSANDLESSRISKMADIIQGEQKVAAATAPDNSQQKINQAEERRGALDMQAQSLKEMGI